MPSYAHGIFRLWWRGTTGLLWYIVDVVAVVLSASMVALPIWIPQTWLQVTSSVVYGVVMLYIFGTYGVAYWSRGGWLRRHLHASLPVA